MCNQNIAIGHMYFFSAAKTQIQGVPAKPHPACQARWRSYLRPEMRRSISTRCLYVQWVGVLVSSGTGHVHRLLFSQVQAHLCADPISSGPHCSSPWIRLRHSSESPCDDISAQFLTAHGRKRREAPRRSTSNREERRETSGILLDEVLLVGARGVDGRALLLLLLTPAHGEAHTTENRAEDSHGKLQHNCQHPMPAQKEAIDETELPRGAAEGGCRGQLPGVACRPRAYIVRADFGTGELVVLDHVDERRLRWWSGSEMWSWDVGIDGGSSRCGWTSIGPVADSILG